jgi:hypothetical protein
MTVTRFLANSLYQHAARALSEAEVEVYFVADLLAKTGMAGRCMKVSDETIYIDLDNSVRPDALLLEVFLHECGHARAHTSQADWPIGAVDEERSIEELFAAMPAELQAVARAQNEEEEAAAQTLADLWYRAAAAVGVTIEDRLYWLYCEAVAGRLVFAP